MASRFRVPPSTVRLPWFLIDIDNAQLITSNPVPKEISDTKKITLTETPIPGLNYEPISPGGMGNVHISFKLPIMDKNNTIGTNLRVKQFEGLRNQAVNFLSLFTAGQFVDAPKVLYSWGTGRLPLVYWTKKCDFKHDMINEQANPQRSIADIELILDEEHPLYKAEEVF